MAALLAAVEGSQQRLRPSGEVLDAKLLTDEHLRIAEVARKVGGAAKPSGAGGGDLVVVFLPSVEAQNRFEAEIEVLSIGESPIGLHVVSDRR